jgi:hypothetical protein
MTQVVQVNGNYKIKVPANTGIITLESKDVVVTGNFTVMGDNTSMEVTNLQIEDRVITVNKGETGDGITGIYAGIEIDRGTANKVAVLYNETDDVWEFVEENLTGYSSATSNLRINQISTDVTINGGNLQLIGNHVGVVTVPNLEFPNSYTSQILTRSNDNDIPNKGYVDYAISVAPPPRDVGSGDTLIIARDKDVFNDLVSVSSITVSVDNFTNTRFFANRTELHNFEIRENIFENPITDQNIVLATTSTGKVEITYGVQLNQISIGLDDPDPVADTSILYSKTPGVADSGVYFVNSSKTDELISKNKALVFSMLF